MRPEDIVNKLFARSFMGYDIEQVDGFLDEVIEAFERYEAEKQEMLSALEYLMKKLERGQKMPLSDMKKAIGPGSPQPANAKEPEDVPARAEEPKTAARSLTRSAAAKPLRAPKVSRVQAEQEAKDRIIREAQAAQQPLSPEEAEQRARSVAAVAASWLDELLINISEHESSDYEKPTAGEQNAAPEPAAKAAEPAQKPAEASAQPENKPDEP